MNKEKILSIICFVVGLFFFVFSFTISGSKATASLGPRAWPVALSLLILILSAFLFIKSNRCEKENTGEIEENKEVEKPAYPQNFKIGFGLLVLYVFLIPYIGFAISTLLFFLANMFMMGFRNVKKLIPLSLLLTAIVVIVFPILLDIPLPRGVAVFNSISRMIY
ncbi:tripartite tricarboxylate transporter TctB family protein [Proteiniborus sp.]|uniref:tripartite tricarboxylate transporter TctB family protein n=1 Tax=Proteiniborus sp. TaxID=2079015 RepID=UPI00332BF503